MLVLGSTLISSLLWQHIIIYLVAYFGLLHLESFALGKRKDNSVIYDYNSDLNVSKLWAWAALLMYIFIQALIWTWKECDRKISGSKILRAICLLCINHLVLMKACNPIIVVQIFHEDCRPLPEIPLEIQFS